jgi:hypothetical protein
VLRRAQQVVAILGRPRGQPPPRLACSSSQPPSSCDPRPPRRTGRHPALRHRDEYQALRSSAAPEDGRGATLPTQYFGTNALRSPAAQEDCRHLLALLGVPVSGQLVAIPGRHGGRGPPPRRRPRTPPSRRCCDPRRPRRTAAAWPSPWPRSHRRRCCDPRLPQRTAATREPPQLAVQDVGRPPHLADDRVEAPE